MQKLFSRPPPPLSSVTMTRPAAALLSRRAGVYVSTQLVERALCPSCRHFCKRACAKNERAELFDGDTRLGQTSRLGVVVNSVSCYVVPSLFSVPSGLVTSPMRRRPFAAGIAAIGRNDCHTQAYVGPVQSSFPLCRDGRVLHVAAAWWSLPSRARLRSKGEQYYKPAYGEESVSASLCSGREGSWPPFEFTTHTSKRRKPLQARQGYVASVVSACCGCLCDHVCSTYIGYRLCYAGSSKSSAFQKFGGGRSLPEIVPAQVTNTGDRQNRSRRTRRADSNRRSTSKSGCSSNARDTLSLGRWCRRFCSIQSERGYRDTDGAYMIKGCDTIACTSTCSFLTCSLCRKRLRRGTPSQRGCKNCDARSRREAHASAVGMKTHVIPKAIHATSQPFRSSMSLCACTHRCCPNLTRLAFSNVPFVFPSPSLAASQPFSSRPATSTPPPAGQPRRQPLMCTVKSQVAAKTGLLSATASPHSLSPEVFYEGEIEEEETPGEFSRSVWMSDVPTRERARLWLKLPVADAAESPESIEGTSQLPALAAEDAARVLPVTTYVERSGRWAGGVREEQRHREQTEHQATIVNRKVNEKSTEEANENRPGIYDECEQTDIDNEDDLFLRSLPGDWDLQPLHSRSLRRAAGTTVSPGSTLLSRLAIAEREALLSIPRTAKKNTENNETFGIGGEVYPPKKIREAVLARERQGAACGDDLQRLGGQRPQRFYVITSSGCQQAFDRRQMPTASRSVRRRQCLGSADGDHYQDTVTENELVDQEGISRKRMRVLDLDSVPVAVLHHSFMFLLVKHLPAEICMRVISRIATYRDIHTQLAYENLIRDLGFLLTKHYEGCTAIPHSLGPAFIAYLSRILQTISIAWSVDYIRRYGCFSKRFIVQQIERSTTPRLFDCVRYERYGGVKPLPPIITHPHRLSSYVRLLDECSAKFYMYTHLKRHGQIPMQQQLQHQVTVQEHLEPGKAKKHVTSFQMAQEDGTCVMGLAGAATLAESTAPPESESIEGEHRLPRAFVAAEKLLQRCKGTRSSSNDGCASNRCSDRRHAVGRRGGKNGERGRARPSTEEDGGLSEDQRDRILEERDGRCELRTGALPTRRPEMYDLILAAEHLGLKQPPSRRLAKLRKSAEGEAFHEEGGDEKLPGAAVPGEDAEICSDDEDDSDEADLRELLIDDDEIYRRIRHKYLRLKPQAAVKLGLPSNQADGGRADKVFYSSMEEKEKDYDGTDNGPGSPQQEEKSLPTSFTVAAVKSGRETVCARTPCIPEGMCAHSAPSAVIEGGCISATSTPADAGSNGRSCSFRVLPYTEERKPDRYERIRTEYAATADFPDRELSNARHATADNSILESKPESQKQEFWTVLPAGYFGANSAIPSVGRTDPFNSIVGLSIEAESSAAASTAQIDALHRSSAECCRMSSEPAREKAEASGGPGPVLTSAESSAASTGIPGPSQVGISTATAYSNTHAAIHNGAAFRMQNAAVAPLEWMTRSRMRRRRDKRTSEIETALLPCTRAHGDEAKWGWRWSFAVDKSDTPSAHKGIEEEGCAATGRTKERWWTAPWGGRGTSFFYKGNSYALIPGQGWKQVNAERSRLLKPKKRNCRHELKRERRMERKARLRRVREEMLRQHTQEEGHRRKTTQCD